MKISQVQIKLDGVMMHNKQLNGEQIQQDSINHNNKIANKEALKNALIAEKKGI